MFATWITDHLEFIAPIAEDKLHAVLVFEYAKTNKIACTVTNADGSVNQPFSNCVTGQAKEHDYWVVPNPGDKYSIEVKYADGNCSGTATPNKPTLKPDGFGGRSTARLNEVDQWVFSDAAGNPICAITIIVIDDIVGPDASSSQQ